MFLPQINDMIKLNKVMKVELMFSVTFLLNQQSFSMHKHISYGIRSNCLCNPHHNNTININKHLLKLMSKFND